MNDIGNVFGLKAGPHPARESQARSESELPADSFKFRDFYRRFMPKLDTAQRLGLPVHAPERAHVPSQALAHSPQYSRSGFFDRGRFRQNLCDRVLHAKAFLAALAILDVVGGPVPARRD